jgi:DNA-binding MarR family transcriptional regulator
MVDQNQRKELHGALLEIVNVLNRPQNDNLILGRAGVTLDTALFPLLVRIERQKGITIGELADQVSRDYSTVSRQVARLSDLGLASSEAPESDRRQRLLSVTAAGRRTVAKIDRARDAVLSEVLADWTDAEVTELTVLVGRLAASLQSRS